jgi:hypothetical protein
LPRIEWAQLEVLSGEGGWTGTFTRQPAEARPIRRRFNEFLARFDRTPALKADIEREFGYLLQSIQHRFAAGTPGARGQIDWQGQGEIRLMQRLSPVEACTPYVFLTSSVLLDFDVRPPEDYPHPDFDPRGSAFRLGMGPLILMYGNLRSWKMEEEAHVNRVSQ